MEEHAQCVTSRVQFSASAAASPTPVISLKALRSPIQPGAMTLSILNNTNKSNYRKYEYGELLIFMKIFLYKTVYEEVFQAGNL